MCILARSTVLLECCLCLSLIPAWAVPLGHCVQVKVFPVTTSPFWELQEPFGEMVLWFVMELGAWCFPSIQSCWDLPGDVCLGCPKYQGRGNCRWIYSHGRRVEKVEEHKRGRHLNNFFPEWSLFNGLARHCVHSGKKLGCNEAEVVKGCDGTSDNCARKEACEQLPLLSCSEHKAGHSTPRRVDVSRPWVRCVQERREPLLCLLCPSFPEEKNRGPGEGSCFAWKGKAMESFENREMGREWRGDKTPSPQSCSVLDGTSCQAVKLLQHRLGLHTKRTRVTLQVSPWQGERPFQWWSAHHAHGTERLNSLHACVTPGSGVDSISTHEQ